MYKPIGWKNRAVEYARRYEMTQGERSGLVYLKPAPGEVDNQGTPVNAENLNHMDEGILNLDQNKVNVTDGDVSDTVATFDQNPTTASENIASGDRLGTLFGKIYNVIKDFFSHKSDKEIHTTQDEKNSWNNSLSDAKTYADAMYSQLTGYTDKKVADLIGGAPETLDTIEEVAAAIKENENVVKALDAAIGKKANQSELDTHTNNDSIHVDAAKQAKWDGYEQRINDINNNLIPLLKIQFDDEYKNAKPCKFLNACWYNNEYNYGFTFVFGASSIGNYVEDTYWLAIRHDGLLAIGVQINNATSPKWYAK